MEAVARDPDQRVLDGVDQAQREQGGPEGGEVRAAAARVEVWGVDVDRQADEGQRQREQAVAGEVAAPERGRAAQDPSPPSSPARRSGAIVRSSSQIPKNSLLKSGSSTRPISSESR